MENRIQLHSDHWDQFASFPPILLFTEIIINSDEDVKIVLKYLRNYGRLLTPTRAWLAQSRKMIFSLAFFTSLPLMQVERVWWSLKSILFERLNASKYMEYVTCFSMNTSNIHKIKECDFAKLFENSHFCIINQICSKCWAYILWSIYLW